MWEELEEMLGQQAAQWMVWEATPIDENIQQLEARGLRSVVFDPCGHAPREGDFLQVMRQNIESLRRVFQ